jgi:hypothetical protein
MALNSYTTIKDAALRWMNREGFTELETDIEDIMAIAQRNIWRTANLNAMLTAGTVTTSARTAALPSGALRIKSVTLQASTQNCELRGAPFRTVMLAKSSDAPRFYTVVGSTMYFGPVPDQEYTLDVIYYVALENISTTNDSNWVVSNYPELILWATLYEALMWLKDDNRAGIYKQRMDSLIAEILKSESELMYEGGSLSVLDPQRVSSGSSL